MACKLLPFAAILAGAVLAPHDAFAQAYAPTGEQAWNYADGIPSLPNRSQWYDPARMQFNSPQYGLGYGGAAAYSWYSPTGRVSAAADLAEGSADGRFIPSASAEVSGRRVAAGGYKRQSYRPKFGYNTPGADTYERQSYQPKYGYGNGRPYGR